MQIPFSFSFLLKLISVIDSLYINFRYAFTRSYHYQIQDFHILIFNYEIERYITISMSLYFFMDIVILVLIFTSIFVGGLLKSLNIPLILSLLLLKLFPVTMTPNPLPIFIIYTRLYFITLFPIIHSSLNLFSTFN